MGKINLKDKAQPREAFLTLLVFVLLIFTFFQYLYLPRSEDVTAIKKRMDLIEKEKNILEKGLKAFKQQTAKTKKQTPGGVEENIKLEILEGNTKPDIENINRFMESVTSSRFGPGLVFESFVYKSSESQSGYQRIPYFVVAQGSFTRLTSFLEKIDNLAALVAIDSLFIEQDPKGQGSMHMELAGSYYQLEGQHALFKN